MKTQSFESRLREAAPTPPSADARARAVNAALAEFNRVQTSNNALGASPQSNRSNRAAWRSRWTRKRLWFGGIATACMVVLSASIVYWVPPGDRLPSAMDIAMAPAPTPATEPAIPPANEPPSAPVSSVDLAEVVITPEHVDAGAAPEQQASAPVALEKAEASEREDAERLASPAGSTPSRHAQSSVSPTPVRSAGSRLIAADEVTVTEQRISAERGRDYALPQLAPRRDRFEHFETNPVLRADDEPVSTFSVDVDTASYSFVRRRLNEGALPPADAVRVEELINYFDYAWPAAESRERPFEPTVTVSDSPWNEGKKLVHIGIKGYQLPAREQPDVNLVLLLDVSGSMNSPDKLPLAQRAMTLLLDSLRPTDTVAIVVYAGAAGQVLAPTPVRERDAIERALYSLRAGGSTAGAEGIRLAYTLAAQTFRDGGVNRILLATDGDFNVGITSRDELKDFVAREREKGIYLSVLGFGVGDYRDELAQALAQNGNGIAAYIDTLNEARKVLVQEATASLFPIAKDVKIQVEFNPATVAEYRLVGYETRALNQEDFNSDKVDAGDVGSGHAVTAIYEITPSDSSARTFAKRRYAEREERTTEIGHDGEYGYLKIRYKLPDENTSRLIEQPISIDAGVPDALREDVAFATAVAGFGQLLRGGKHTGALSYEDIVAQAKAAVGDDRHGYRSEFVQLARQAQYARGL